MVLVGNKKDLADERTVSFEEANNLAQKSRLEYFETSAATGEGIELLMPSFFEKMLEYMKKIENEAV